MKAILEGLLFVVGDEGITKDQIKSILEIDDEELDEITNNLNSDYESVERGISLTVFGNRLKMITKKEHKEYLQRLIDLDDNDTLSDSALETLAIIAYNQPVTRLVVDEIRGVSSSHMVRKLVYKNLICEVGRAETAGRPILYGTTDLFLDYFGLKTLSELPEVNIELKDEELELYDSKYVENIE